MGRFNDVKKIVGARLCPQQPVQSDIGGRWSYPWADMQPGDVIVVPDPSRRARSALTAAAAQWTKRHGALFATGVDWDVDVWPHVRRGWWCARVDGCEILPPELSELRATIRAEKHASGRMDRARSGKTKRARRQRIEPIAPLVTAAGGGQAGGAPGTYAHLEKARRAGGGV